MMKHYRFFVGSGDKFFPQWGRTMRGVVEYALEKYSIRNYTMVKGVGTWMGTKEETLIFEVVDNTDIVIAAINEVIDMTDEQSVMLLESSTVTQFCPCPYGTSDIPPSLKF